MDGKLSLDELLDMAHRQITTEFEQLERGFADATRTDYEDDWSVRKGFSDPLFYQSLVHTPLG